MNYMKLKVEQTFLYTSTSAVLAVSYGGPDGQGRDPPQSPRPDSVSHPATTTAILEPQDEGSWRSPGNQQWRNAECGTDRGLTYPPKTH